MFVTHRILLGAALICCCYCLPALADPPELTPQPGILVLHNGRVLRGDIIRVADRFVIALGGQDQVTISSDRVAMRCKSLEDAYQRKRRGVGANASVNEHLKLGDWCLRYGMLAAAAEQLLQAMRIQPSDPRLAVFEKRLRLAAHQSHVATEPSSQNRSKFIPQSVLDQTIERLPPGAVETFTTVIQPLLLNGCSTAQCHGSGHDGPYHLLRPIGKGSISRRFTQRNLYATLSQCNRQSPLQSPLLLRATAAHANAHLPVLGPENAHQRQALTNWLFELAGKQADVPRQLAVDAKSPQLPQPASITPTPPPAAPSASESVQPARTASEPRSSRVKCQVQAAAHNENKAPVDPFDPAIFNRRYAKRPAGRT